MRKKNGLTLIAIGIALTHEARLRTVAELNQSIDAFADTLKSSTDNDGMPHGSGTSDSTANRVMRIEALERRRNIEQERIDAVEWAMKYVMDIYSDEDANHLKEAIFTFLKGNKDEALEIIECRTDIKTKAFYQAKKNFLIQILKYLNFYNL